MKHIQHKTDWFYEFRPMLILMAGLIGLLNGNLIGSPSWIHVSQICGIILLSSAFKIFQWRKQYRQKMKF